MTGFHGSCAAKRARTQASTLLEGVAGRVLVLGILWAVAGARLRDI